MQVMISDYPRPKPVLQGHLPDWCHGHCLKMKQKQLSVKRNSLSILSNVAALKIKRCDFPVEDGWFVEWEVIHDPWSKVSGQIVMNTEEIKAAFALSEKSSQDSNWLLNRYGGDSAVQGKYIRWKNYLNIPCPGTGQDGDPNISIKIDENIKGAILQLLNQNSFQQM